MPPHALTLPFTALFPDCCLPDCPESGTEHQHVFPKQQAMLESRAQYLYVQGGVGSAKSIACAAKAVWLSCAIPKNVGVVSRKDYKLLYKSAWLDIKACLQRLAERGYIPKPKYSDKRQGDYSTITLWNSSILYGMQGKSWQEGLGPSYGWFLVDDAMESLEEMFIGNDVSAGLLSRLRLPHVRYFRDSAGRVSNRLHGMVTSNPPPVGHWLHKLFGREPGLYKIGNDTVEWMMIETMDNPFMGADYAIGLIAAQQKMGHHSNTTRRIIFGESIPAYGGSAVYPQFSHNKHVGSFVYDKALPLVAGWDFGVHHPAVVFSQLLKCSHGTYHYISLSEVAEAFSVTVYSLYEDYVRPHMKAQGYTQSNLVLHAGDTAGYRLSSSNRDRRGDMKILQEEYKLPFRHKHLDLNNSLQYMRSLLEPKKACKCGRETILIDHVGCPVLIGALEGGYKYSKDREGKLSQKPVEDRYFADIACAWRYGAENYVRFGVPWHMLTDTETPTEPPHLSGFGQQKLPWEWMTDTQMGKMLH